MNNLGVNIRRATSKFPDYMQIGGVIDCDEGSFGLQNNID